MSFRIITDAARRVQDEAEFLVNAFGRMSIKSPSSAGLTPKEKESSLHGLFQKIGSAADDLFFLGKADQAKHMLEICKRDAQGHGELVQIIERKAESLGSPTPDL